MSELEPCGQCLDPEAMLGLAQAFQACETTIVEARVTNDERWQSAIDTAAALSDDLARGEHTVEERQAMEQQIEYLHSVTARRIFAFGDYSEVFLSVKEGMQSLDCSSAQWCYMDICPKIGYLASRMAEIGQAEEAMAEVDAI